MLAPFTLRYRIDGGWYVGRSKEVLGVFTQGHTLGELEGIRDAYELMSGGAEEPIPDGALSKFVAIEV